jgi:hypothetical protein
LKAHLFCECLNVPNLSSATPRRSNIKFVELVSAGDVKSDVCLSFAFTLIKAAINFDNKEGKINPFYEIFN